MKKKQFVYRHTKTAKALDEAWLRHGERDDEHSAMLNLYVVAKTTFFPGRDHLIQRDHDDTWGIQLFIEGKGEITVNELPSRPLFPGDCILHLPGVKKKIMIGNTSAGPLKSLYFLIERDWKIELFFKNLTMQEQLLIHLNDFTPVRETFEKLFSLIQTQKDIPCLMENLSANAFLILTILSRSVRQSMYGKSETFTHILTNISLSPHSYSTIKSLTESFHVSRGKLYRLFRENVGISPIEYVIRKRLVNSMWQLRYTEMPIDEIALQNGYKDPVFYARSFKKLFEISPSVFRKNGAELMHKKEGPLWNRLVLLNLDQQV